MEFLDEGNIYRPVLAEPSFTYVLQKYILDTAQVQVSLYWKLVGTVS